MSFANARPHEYAFARRLENRAADTKNGTDVGARHTDTLCRISITAKIREDMARR